MAARKRHQQFSEKALDALIGDAKTPEDLDALFRRMKKALAERISRGRAYAPPGLRRGGGETGRAAEPAQRHHPNLAVRNISAKWKNARTHWTTALTYFAQLFGDRLTPEA